MGSREVDEQVAFIERSLREAADPSRAAAMAKYMKSALPFYGVSRPQLKAITQAAKKKYPISTHDDYVALVSRLWAGKHREDKYAAILLARSWRKFVGAEHIALYRRMIEEGAWWDFVDEIAVHLIGPMVRANPTDGRTLMDHWIDDPHLWVRRTAILCQLSFGGQTDADMLFDYCERRMRETDFFIRKAIGWALREYSKADPKAVRAFVDTHAELSPLSRREATKYC